jgi:hypothetical protein
VAQVLCKWEVLNSNLSSTKKINKVGFSVQKVAGSKENKKTGYQEKEVYFTIKMEEFWGGGSHSRDFISKCEKVRGGVKEG